jgi:hypothetical protein
MFLFEFKPKILDFGPCPRQDVPPDKELGHKVGLSKGFSLVIFESFKNITASGIIKFFLKELADKGS